MSPNSTHPGKHRKRNRRPAIIAAVALAVAALSGCQSIDMSSAQLRVIDASPDAGVIDSYQNSSALAYNLGFGTMTSYVPMSPGTYTLAADKAGTRQALVANTEALVAGKQYTEIVGGSLANMQQNVLLDQTTPAPTGEVAVRLVNEATRSGAVDIYLVPASGRLLNTSPIAVSLGFGANSGYIDIPEGTYAIDVVASGTVLTASTATLLSGVQDSYTSGSVRTIVLIDQKTMGTQHEAAPLGVQSIVADDVDAQ